MKPYGITIKDRRPMYDYGPDKYNSRGCFNKCNCNICKKRKSKIRKDTSRKRSRSINVLNIMRACKKKARRILKEIKYE